MNYRIFQKAFEAMPVISIKEIEKKFPDFDGNALTRWQKAGYIERLRNGYYRFGEKGIEGNNELFFIANQIYSPSYISLQSAMSWYGFIPEGVFTTTSVSTLKTQFIECPVGHFSYQHIKPNLFFGYKLETFGKVRFKIADPAKCLLDFLYLNPGISTEDSFYELRLNLFEIAEQVSIDDFNRYLTLYNSKALNQRSTVFLKYLSSYAATH